VPKVSDSQLAARRAEILDGARRAFARHGYEGATVRVLEAETGLSRGAIFHHFKDKDALFLALAEDDAAEMAATVAQHGLVQVMRDLQDKDAGWLGVQLEVRRRAAADPRGLPAARPRRPGLRPLVGHAHRPPPRRPRPRRGRCPHDH
jgi:AcrR family transcriptional regulator